jgi:GNAT superfamily N-acetyltransferase
MWRRGRGWGFWRFDESRDEAWAVTCLFISRSFRGAGVGKALIEAAVDMAARRGAQSLVGVPRGWRPEGGSEGVPDVVSRFVQAGFAVTEEGAPFLVRRGLAL